MAPANIKDVLTAFSPDSNYLALTSGDGRIKTWDVASGHMRGELVDIAASTSGVGTATGALANGHLAVDYTSIAWGSSSASAEKKIKKRKASFLLALGTGSGEVLAWDTALGGLRWRKDDVHPGGVKSITFSKNAQRLYTAGADGLICELDAGDGQVMQKLKGSKIALSSVTLSPDGDKLLAASAEIKLFDLSSKKRIRKFTGHPAAVKAMAFTEDGRYFLSCAAGDRHVAVWTCDRQKSETGATFTLSMEQPAVALHCRGSGENEGRVRVLALSETGIVYVWIASSMEELSKVKPVKISVGQDTAASNTPGKGSKSSRSCILAARLVGAAGDGFGAILVARGTVARPQFERVSLDGQTTKIVLACLNNSDLLSGGQHTTGGGKTRETPDVAVLGPDNTVDAVLTRSHVESDGKILKTPRKDKKRRAPDEFDSDNRLVDQSSLTEPQAGGAAAMDVDAVEELSMEDRLISLGLIESEDKQVAEQNEESDCVVVPRADTLHVPLSQAIQSDDNTLLERCVAVSNDDRVITKTVSKLHVHDAAKFLRLMVFKLESRPRRGLTLVPWIRAALLQHAASLMSTPSMQPVLTSLYQIIDARIAVFRPLLSLSGRLDLILAQMPITDTQQQNLEGPAVVYEDEGSEPESEDVMDEVEEHGDSENELGNEQEDWTLRPNGNGTLQDDGETDDDML